MTSWIVLDGVLLAEVSDDVARVVLTVMKDGENITPVTHVRCSVQSSGYSLEFDPFNFRKKT